MTKQPTPYGAGCFFVRPRRDSPHKSLWDYAGQANPRISAAGGTRTHTGIIPHVILSHARNTNSATAAKSRAQNEILCSGFEATAGLAPTYSAFAERRLSYLATWPLNLSYLFSKFFQSFPLIFSKSSSILAASLVSFSSTNFIFGTIFIERSLLIFC